MADKNLKAVESKSKTKKEPVSFKKVLTIIIIAILALLMLGGIYYIVLMFQQSKAQNMNAWGFYDGEPILLESNNVFYNTLVNDSELQNAYLNGDYNTLMSSYYTAYQAQVVYTAVSKEAKQAGILTTQNLVNDMILTAGVFNDENGNYSEEIFNQATESEKLAINTYYTNYYPYNQVLVDLQLAIVPEKEVKFVEQMGMKTREFDYFIVDYHTYPDELAIKYANENRELFDKAKVSVISTSTIEKANEAYEQLKSGTEWNDVVKNYSIDSFAATNGQAGELMMFSIMTNLKNEDDIQQIKALKAGEYTQPLESPYGYTIYKLDNDIVVADPTNETTLEGIKYYIQTNSIDDVTSYVEAAVAKVGELAKTDFDAAAKSIKAEILSVGATSDNIGKSQYLGNLTSLDTEGYLAEAADDEAVSRELYTSELNHVTDPIKINSAQDTYVIAQVATDRDDNTTNAYVTTTLYYYYAQYQPAYDKFYSVLNSDKHTDNFYTQFFTTVFGNATTTTSSST